MWFLEKTPIHYAAKNCSRSHRDAAGQKILTRGSGRVFCLPLGSERVGSANFLKVDGSGRAGSALKNSCTGRVGSKFVQNERAVGKPFFNKTPF